MVLSDTADSPAPVFDNASMAAKIAFYFVFLKMFI
jgi:hypothetical protein